MSIDSEYLSLTPSITKNRIPGKSAISNALPSEIAQTTQQTVASDTQKTRH
jgi:hypothetical protein